MAFWGTKFVECVCACGVVSFKKEEEKKGDGDCVNNGLGNSQPSMASATAIGATAAAAEVVLVRVPASSSGNLLHSARSYLGWA